MDDPHYGPTVCVGPGVHPIMPEHSNTAVHLTTPKLLTSLYLHTWGCIHSTTPSIRINHTPYTYVEPTVPLKYYFRHVTSQLAS